MQLIVAACFGLTIFEFTMNTNVDLDFYFQDLNNEMFSSILRNLVNFVKNSHNEVVEEVPTAALLTGINMPDHVAQFKGLSKQIKTSVTPHIACLYSQECQNIKYLVENMISQFLKEEVEEEVSDNVGRYS